MSANPIDRELVQRAQQAMAAGRLDEAARLWEQVLASAPDHPQALFHLGQHRLLRSDPRGALQLLGRAASASPNEPSIPLNISFVHRSLGDANAEMEALVRALSLNPYFFPALLAKARLLERLGKRKSAADVYQQAFVNLPPENQLMPEMQAAVAHGREVVEQNSRALSEHLAAQLGPVYAKLGQHGLDRFEECKEIAIGRKKAYTQQPSMLLFPRLPPIQFYERSEFPWLEELESSTGQIREELLVVLKQDSKDFQPYVNHPAGTPVNQWAELNHSPRWSTFYFWKDGEKYEQHCADCPKTAAAIQKVPTLGIPQFGPTVMFSNLAPRTKIPAHSSVTNVRLVVHLPLIVPEGCRFRVGNETRDWREGHAWVFDDTIEHEAWNDSGSLRVILMMDVWNPYLTPAERELVSVLLNARRDYYRTE